MNGLIVVVAAARRKRGWNDSTVEALKRRLLPDLWCNSSL